jgi:hypothetical protein
MKIPNTITLQNKRYVCRIYDNGGLPEAHAAYDQDANVGSADRYTICYKGYYDASRNERVYPYTGASAFPFHPQGIGVHDENRHTAIDRPNGKHLGKRIRYEDCPEQVQRLIRQDLEVPDLNPNPSIKLR